MSIELGRRLIAAGAVHPSEIEAAFYRQLIGQIPFVRALLELGHVTEEVLEQELAHGMVPFLATIVPLPAIVDELPNQMCRRLMAVPVRRDPRTGLIDVAAVDPFDAHIPYEFSYHLKSEVRVLRGSLAAIEQALSRIDRGEYTASVILRKSVRPPGYATPSVPPLRSDRPIPLVRKSKRSQLVEVHEVRNIAGPPPNERQGPADFRSPQVPGAPSMPTFAGGQSQPQPVPRARQQTAPGPPGVPKRQEPPQPPPVPASVRARPDVPVAVPSTRGRPEVPGTAKGRPETPAASPPSSKAATPSSSPSSRSSPSSSPSSRSSSSRSSASGAASASQPRPEPRGGPPPPPLKAPTPATAGSGAKARSGTSGRPPAATATSSASGAASPAKASASPTAATRARSESSGISPAPERAAEGAKKGRSSSSPPPTTRGPFSPRAPAAPFADIRGVLAAMEAATTRDDVIDCLIVGMSTVARRVGVFAVKKGHYRGVACNAALGDPARFRAIEISTEATTVLGIAATSGSYLGPLPVTQPHEDLLAFMKDASHEVTASLIRVAGRPAVILFAEGLGDTLIATRRAEELGHEASLAFSRILTDAKASRGHA